MKYHTLFLRLLDSLVLLGILAYSVAEEDLSYFLAALPIVSAAALLTAGPMGLILPRWLINLLLLTATATMTLSWFRDPGDIISVLSRYVIWLQLIKMFEQKAPRDHAQVIILSAMLVLGACLTSVRPDLGGALALYAPALLATLMLFQIVAGQSHTPLFPPQLDSPDSKRFALLPGDHAGANDLRAVFGPHSGRDLRRLFLGSGLTILALALPLYFLTPRGLGEALVGGWPPPASTKSVVGFRDHVQLGAQGLLSESRAVVMEIRVESSTEPGPYSRPILLRGAVLDEYDPTQGLWRQSPGLWSAGRIIRGRPEDFPEPDPHQGPFLTQRITAVDQSAEFFSCWRPLSIAFDSRIPTKSIPIRWNNISGLVLLSDSRSDAPLQYTIVSAPSNSAPPRLLPSLLQRTGVRLSRKLPSAGRLICRKPTDDAAPGNPFLTGPVHDLALSILRDHNLDPDPSAPDQREWAAAAFRNHLQKNYSYTLEMEAPPPGRDPIESFLFDSNDDAAGGGGKGHCEYFASALAALCQSIAIPARVVTGYAATEFDASTGLYTIRQNHAHAWTDVELAPGRWREFDPSPTAAVSRIHSPPPGLFTMVRGIIDSLQMAWIKSIVSFDRGHQADALRVARDSPLSALSWANHWLSQRLAQRDSDGERENPAASVARVFAGVLVASTILALIFFALMARGGALIRRLFRLLRAPLPKAIERLQDPGRRELALLRRRLDQRLHRAGLQRPRHTPAAEHARSLTPRDPDLARDALRLIHIYYASKFGGLSPDRPTLLEARALAHSLRLRLASHRTSTPPSPSSTLQQARPVREQSQQV